MIRYHNNGTVAEILPGSINIKEAGEILDLMAESGMNGAVSMIIHRESLPGEFFDLKTRIAGEILQKFSNYRMKLAVIGDFTGYGSKSLRDFIRESNRTGSVLFVPTVSEALQLLR